MKAGRSIWYLGCVVALLVACESGPALTNPGATSSPTHSADVSPAPTPSARWESTLAYDGSNHRLVLFGGRTGGASQPLDDTWVRDSHSWKQVRATPHPEARFSAAAVGDIAHNEIVLFGGYGTGPLGDTWAWDGLVWTQRHPTSRPTPRFGQSMAYDSVRKRVVLFGGQSGPNSMLSDTWTWDGQNWSQLRPDTSPTPKAFAAMAFDESAGVIVLTGVYPDVDLSTWIFDGNTWSKHAASAGNQPWADDTPAAFYPKAHQVLILVAGPRPTDLPTQMLAWDGARWSSVTAAALPPPRVGGALAYFPDLDRLVVFGGARAPLPFGGVAESDVLSDTWVWDGMAWTQIT